MNARRLVDVADPRIDGQPLGKRLDVTRADWFVGPGPQHRLVAADVEECSDLEPIVPRLTALEPVGRLGRLLSAQLLERAIEALLRCVGHAANSFVRGSSRTQSAIARLILAGAQAAQNNGPLPLRLFPL